MRSTLLTLVVAAAALLAGYAVYEWRAGGAAHGEAGVLWSRALQDTEGNARTIAQWRGKVLVVNFWATWCEPCREEIPMFVKLQREYGERGLQFVGVAIDDPAKVVPFARQFGINYPLLVGGIDAVEWSRQLGNRAGGLPYTLIIGRDGAVRESHLGEIKEATLLPFIRELL